MELFNILLFWLHLMSLALAGVAAFGVPLLARRMPKVDAAARPALAGAIDQFSKLGSAAFGTIVLTGIILVFTKYGGIGAMSASFWAKIALVVILAAVIINNKRLGARAMAGDAEAAARGRQMAWVAIALLGGVVLVAVLTFG